MSWALTDLESVCVKITDGSHNPPKGIEHSNYMMLSSKNVFDDNIHFTKPRYLKKEDFEQENKRTDVSAGDVLLTIVGTIGRTAVYPNSAPKVTLQRSVAVLKPDPDKIDSRYMMYALNACLDILLGQARGVAQKGLYLKTLRKQPIPLPTLNEQKRIVAILDQAFEGIDKAIVNTEQNLKNARELFDSYLNNIFTQKGAGWTTHNLEDAVTDDCSLSYGIVQPGNDVPDGLPVVRPTDMKSNIVHLEGLKRIDPSLAESYQRTKLAGGELLLCVRGSTGVTSVAAAELVGSNVTRGIVPIRFDQSIVDQNFGYYFLVSKYAQDQIKSGTYGAALMQINIRDVKKIVVTAPPLEAQSSLLKILESLDTETNSLVSIYSQKLIALKELKQSLLQKAFAGELTVPHTEGAAKVA